MAAGLIRIGLVVAILGLAAWAPSPPPGTTILRSQTFRFSGRCTGQDMVYSWSINNSPSGEGIAPKPGERGAASAGAKSKRQLTEGNRRNGS